MEKIEELESHNISINLDNIKSILFRKNEEEGVFDNNKKAIDILANYDYLYKSMQGGKTI